MQFKFINGADHFNVASVGKKVFKNTHGEIKGYILYLNYIINK